MNLDFSHCKTAEDVKKVFSEQHVARRLGWLNKKVATTLRQFKYIHHPEGYVTRVIQ